MGLSSKKSKSSTQESATTSTTMTRTNPEWATAGAENLAGQIANLSKIDPQSLVTGPSALQQKAFGLAGNLSGPNNLFGEAASQARAVMGADPVSVGPVSTVAAASLLDGGLDRYYSPYQEDVIDAALADFDFGADQARAQERLNLAGNDAFGGSGVALTRAATEDALTRGRASTSATLRDQGFTRATGLASDDANRRQQASMANAAAANQAAMQDAAYRDAALGRGLQGAGLLGQMGEAQDSSQRANIGLLGDLGEVERGIAQQKAGAGLNLLQMQSGLFGALPLDIFSGTQTNGTSSGSSTTTQKQSGSIMDAIGQAVNIAAAAAAFSDADLKADIKTLGHDDKGRRWVSYRYKWDKPGTQRQGLIAQEVAVTDPHAVTRHESGFLMVDYGAL